MTWHNKSVMLLCLILCHVYPSFLISRFFSYCFSSLSKLTQVNQYIKVFRLSILLNTSTQEMPNLSLPQFNAKGSIYQNFILRGRSPFFFFFFFTQLQVASFSTQLQKHGFPPLFLWLFQIQYRLGPSFVLTLSLTLAQYSFLLPQHLLIYISQ